MHVSLKHIELFRDYSSAVAFNQMKLANDMRTDFNDEDWEDYFRHKEFLFAGLLYYRFVLTGSRDETEDFIIRMLATYQSSRAKLKASVIRLCLEQALETEPPPTPDGLKFSKLYETRFLIMRSIVRERADVRENFSHFLDFADEMYVTWHSQQHTPAGTKYNWLDDFYY